MADSREAMPEESGEPSSLLRKMPPLAVPHP
jgi:hypothetical protein